MRAMLDNQATDRHLNTTSMYAYLASQPSEHLESA
jgi:hypothetical protein